MQNINNKTMQISWFTPAAFISMLTVTTLGIGCIAPSSTSTQSNTNSTIETDSVMLDDSTLAQALLTSADVADSSPQAWPSLVELDNHFDNAYLSNYTIFAARSWYNADDGRDYFSNAITEFASSADAQAEMHRLTSDDFSLAQVGDDLVANYTAPLYYYGSSDADPAVLLVRFTVNNYMVKIQLADQGNALDDADVIADRLRSEMTAIMQAQYDRLLSVLLAPTTEPVSNGAIHQLPNSISAGTLVGTANVTEDEWQAAAGNIPNHDLTGFVSGGLRRFQLISRPTEAVEVTVLEFETAAQAETYRQAFLTSGAIVENEASIVSLPAAIDAISDAAEYSNTVEMQANQGVYLIDIAIFAPFTDTDIAAAQTDIVPIAEEVLGL